MPSRPLCLISFLSLEDVLLDCQHATKLTQPAKNCRIYFNKVKLLLPTEGILIHLDGFCAMEDQ